MLHYVLFFNAICSSEAQFLDKDCVFVCLCVLNLITLSQIKLNLGYGTFSWNPIYKPKNNSMLQYTS